MQCSKKERIVFGFVGMYLACLFMIQDHFWIETPSDTESWPMAVFLDFIPWHAYAFVFAIFLMAGSIAQVSGHFNWSCCDKLKAIAKHVEYRLIQIASLVISFISGFAVTGSCYIFIVTTLIQSLCFAGVMLWLIVMVLLILAIPIISFNLKIKPWNKWWGQSIIFLAAFCLPILFLFTGV